MSWLNQPYQGGYPGQQTPQQQQQFMQPQPTGYMGQPLQGQPTGFMPQSQFQQPQATGFMGGRPPMQMQSQPTGYQPMMQPQPTGYPSAMPQRPMTTGYPSMQQSQPQQPSFMSAQPTGMPGMGGGMQSQFLSTFMPAANLQPTPYLDPSQMQFAHNNNTGPSLASTFQQRNQAQTGQANVPIPWQLTRDEKKRYDQIFRAWDQQGTGFIEGRISKEVFGQSGLDQNDLMAIWNLADVQDRGKLNIDEFHVAMGLIYRRLNGNPIPQTLPAEMAPPSARDLDDSVGFLTNLLKNDTNQRSTNQDQDGRGSMAKARSLHDTAPRRDRKDATVFRNDDDEARSVYKSSARHLNRDQVRSRSETESPSSDLDDIKHRLKSTQSALERSRDQDEEEEDLRDELRNLNRRIQRVQDDIEYNLRSGRRTAAKDDERRKLERELLKLEHEELPELERRIKDKERDKKRDQQKYALERDSRNNGYDRYGDRDRYSREDSHESKSSRRESPERGYSRGTYDNHEQERRRDDRSRDRDRYATSPSRRTTSPPAQSRTPPPPPPPAAKSAAAAAPPPLPAPKPSAVDTKSMTPAERQAHIRAQAQARIQERLRALGVAAPAGSDTGVDTSVADRLEQEKAEAAAKAAKADEELKAKELERQAKLEREKLRGVAIEQSINNQNEATVDQVREEVKASAAPPIVVQAANDQLNAEEDALARREAQLQRERAERLARIQQLEQEAREAEENFAKSKAMFTSASKPKSAPPPPASRSRPAPPPSRGPAKVAPPPQTQAGDDGDDFAPSAPRSSATAPLAPTPPPASAAALSPPARSEAASVSPSSESKNPFHRLQQGAVSPAASSTSASTPNKPNPFFKPAAAPVAAPAVSKPAYKPPPVEDDDWDAGGLEKNVDESDSDDEGIGGGRAAQANLAANLFRGLGLGTARPSSAQDNTPPTRSFAASPALGAPAAPAPPAAPSAPSAPVAPSAPAAPKAPFVPPAEAPPRSALLGAIQGGLKLKKTETKDKSGPAVTGSVIGDPSPPVQVYRAPSPPPSPPRAPSPPPAPAAAEATHQNGNGSFGESHYNANRQSVAWLGDMAVDGGSKKNDTQRLPLPTTVAEEEEDEPPQQAQTLPAIVSGDDEDTSAFDMTTSHRMKTVFAFQGDGPSDLSFSENLILKINPAKDASSDWVFGTIESSGQKGWVPKSYVEAFTPQTGKALYSYTGASDEELSFEENETLSIIDSTDASWWSADKDGLVKLVPATYIELGSSGEHRVTEVTANDSKPPANSTAQNNIPSSLSLDRTRVEDDLTQNREHISDDDDSDSDDDAESPSARDPRQKEAERLRVLEAAGLLVVDSSSPATAKKIARRKAPARPPLSTRAPVNDESAGVVRAQAEELAPTPVTEEEQEERMEDAYDAYQRAMREVAPISASTNRFSIVSDSIASPSLSSALDLSSPSSPALSSVPTTASASTSASIKDHWHATTSGLRAKISRASINSSATGDRPRLSISGPITNGSKNGPELTSGEPTGGQTFGSTWASLIDPSALENMPDRERKRQESIFEFISTEQAYVKSLQLTIEVFFEPLQTILPQKATQIIFANIEDILLHNTILLSELEERQRSSRLYIDMIGDVIKIHIRGFECYRVYCVNQANASRTLADLKSSDPQLRSFLEGARVKGLELEHFLLEPMQRITRVPLLLRQIIRYTDADQPDAAPLNRSLEISESILGAINEAVRAHENQEKLTYLSEVLGFDHNVDARLNLTAPTRYMGPRRLLKEDQVTKAKSGRKLMIYLFNDLIILTESKAGSRSEMVYRWPIPLEECAVREHPRDDLSFVIAIRGGSINVRASSARQCLAWLKAIDQARAACLTVLQKRNLKG